MRTTDKPLMYLATVLSKHPISTDAAHMDAVRLLGKLMHADYRVYSPIAHCYLAEKVEGLPTTHEYWLEIDEAWIDKCDILLVAQMEGWDQSIGITHEIQYAKQTGKKILYLDIKTLEMQDTPYD